MTDYEREVQKMRDIHCKGVKNTSQIHMNTLVNAIELANSQKRSWFFIDLILCEDVLEIAKNDYNIAYYKRKSISWGRYGEKKKLVYKIATSEPADSMRLQLIGVPQLPESYYDGEEA